MSAGGHPAGARSSSTDDTSASSENASTSDETTDTAAPNTDDTVGDTTAASTDSTGDATASTPGSDAPTGGPPQCTAGPDGATTSTTGVTDDTTATTSADSSGDTDGGTEPTGTPPDESTAASTETTTETSSAGWRATSSDDATTDATTGETTGTTDETTDATTDETTDGTTTDGTMTLETTTTVDKPDVEIPEEIPTELQVTTLEEGSGVEAAEGSTVVLNYVGVLSKDGTEFDNSYERGQPITVTLGEGGIIPGLQQGLEGVQTGARVQLDIPSELAYGAAGAGDAIGPDEALTFVVDIVAVIPVNDPAEEPGANLAPLSDGVGELTTDDVTVGDGPEASEGMTVWVNLAAFDGTEGTLVQSTWAGPMPLTTPLVEGALLPGLVQGLQGMKVGGCRVITMPPDLAFGPDGYPEINFPADTDLVVVAVLLAAY